MVEKLLSLVRCERGSQFPPQECESRRAAGNEALNTMSEKMSSLQRTALLEAVRIR